MAANKPVVTQENGVWVVRVVKPGGKTQEFRCTAEQQALHLALVFSETVPAPMPV